MESIRNLEDLLRKWLIKNMLWKIKLVTLNNNLSDPKIIHCHQIIKYNYIPKLINSPFKIVPSETN